LNTHPPKKPSRGKSKRDPARSLALDILARVLVNREPMDKILAAQPVQALEGRDRSFAHMAAATVLRRLGEIDACYGQFITRPLPKSAHAARDILRLGVAELLYLRTPAHAAVSSAVNLAGAAPKARHYRGMINAVLRRVSRENPDREASSPGINAPPWLYERWVRHYGKKTAAAIAQSHLTPAPIDISVKSDPAGWAEKLGGRALPTGSIRLEGSPKITDLAGYASGDWWVQGVGAALPVRLLGDLAGKSAIDLCAAPGGKTLQLIAAGARVTALDISAKRMVRVQENLTRTRYDAEIVVADALTWRPPVPADIVLLDAPCLSTGTIRRHPDLPYLKSEDQLEKLVQLQEKLLGAAAEMTGSGGILLYCVCSLEPEEGEDQIRRFLENNSQFHNLPVNVDEIGRHTEFLTRNGMVRTLPGQGEEWGGIEGFFIARLEKI